MLACTCPWAPAPTLALQCVYPHTRHVLLLIPLHPPLQYLPRGEEALEELDVDDGYLLLVATQQPDGSWPEPASPEDVEGAEQRPIPAHRGVPGRVGLANLGNTCYMNAALQCLAHTRPLTEYFLSGDFVYDVNTVNKAGMGMQGRLAVAYASLVRDMWSGRRMAMAPWQFKRLFGKFKPEFNGFDQQDSQEFLQHMLTGLAEDLNRVGAKPYSEQPDSDGRPDHVVAAEWWANHWRRECSVITKLFTGQFRVSGSTSPSLPLPLPARPHPSLAQSVLRCLTCGHESARFEPFQMLQLPLPERSTRPLRIVLVPPHRAFPVQLCAVTVPNTGTVADITAALVRIRPLQGVQVSVEVCVRCSGCAPTRTDSRPARAENCGVRGGEPRGGDRVPQRPPCDAPHRSRPPRLRASRRAPGPRGRAPTTHAGAACSRGLRASTVLPHPRGHAREGAAAGHGGDVPRHRRAASPGWVLRP